MKRDLKREAEIRIEERLNEIFVKAIKRLQSIPKPNISEWMFPKKESEEKETQDEEEQ